ncbi:LysR family transcriptional regulator [Terriglobus albidus]|uniref:LysR family transcriptional regulator n=2 Tax=Terriglobus albidus TaxID=1592106 RepID=A0A5B9EAQ2_9BACT|nr:LysR family transcriptional regulator [Terriglobus albidus]
MNRVQRIDMMTCIGIPDGSEAVLDLKQVRTFAEVAREKSFTRAASQLHYAQSSVTAQVHALESELGLPLFNRLGRQVELTAAGTQFLAYATRLLVLAEEARTSVQKSGQVVGPLVITASESLLTYRLPDLLRSFQCTYPGVQLTLHTSTQCASVSPLEPGIDIAITIDEPIEVPQLLVKRVRREPMLALVAKEHALAGQKKVTAAEIAEQQILLTERSCSYRALFERTLAQCGGRVSKCLEFASVEALKQCALARMGVAVLPEVVVADELEKGNLVALPWPEKRLAVYTQVVRHRDKWFSPVMQAFWSMALEMLAER